MVLDCTAAQVAEIEAWLEAEYRAGRLVWGLHEDSAALMTCLVFSLERSEHVHFVDAAGGGFAKAAEASSGACARSALAGPAPRAGPVTGTGAPRPAA